MVNFVRLIFLFNFFWFRKVERFGRLFWFFFSVVLEGLLKWKGLEEGFVRFFLLFFRCLVFVK